MLIRGQREKEQNKKTFVSKETNAARSPQPTSPARMLVDLLLGAVPAFAIPDTY